MRARPKVAIVMGSESDREAMRPAIEMFLQHKVPHSVRVLSAHRQPDETRAFAKSARRQGLKVIIAAAGLSAALPGAIASYTDLPVIGVPMESGKLKGFDALLSIVQMPKGVPVACVTLGSAGPANAALLAMRILGVMK